MGAVNTTNTFTATDVITSTKMNNIIDQTVMTSDAIIGSTLQIVAPGKLQVTAGGITSNELANNAITTLAITDANVTPAKLANTDFGDFTVANGVATLDNDAVTTVKILNDNVTTAKIADDAITTLKILNSNVTPVKLSEPRVFETAKLTTSGNSPFEYTGIPSYVKKITVILNNVACSSSTDFFIQIGSGTYSTSGYSSSAVRFGTSSNVSTNVSGGFLILSTAAIATGILTINLLDGFQYVASGSSKNSITVGTSPVLSGAIDRIRLIQSGFSPTFISGKFNIIYE